MTLAAVTAFLVVTATAAVEGRRARSAALINARLVGAPDDRKARLLSAQLKDSDDLIRYLLFLLFDLVDDARLDQLLLIKKMILEKREYWGSCRFVFFFDRRSRVQTRFFRLIDVVYTLDLNLFTTNIAQ